MNEISRGRLRSKEVQNMNSRTLFKCQRDEEKLAREPEN